MVIVDVLEQLARSTLNHGLRCSACGRTIQYREIMIRMYPHGGGIPLRPGSEHRFWIYVECPRCGYQNSIEKLSTGGLVE